MIYGSVCSGIEAASVAWHPLGWRGAFVSEIEPFARAVLAHRWPEIPLHGDFTTIDAGQYEPIDLLIGGTPCQSFSVAGLRGGLDDDRGNLALEFCRLVDRLRPRWVVWENVPGVRSSGDGRDFGAILGALGQLGYGWAYRSLDAQYAGLAQRRERVFVVGCLGDWRRAAAVLFERHSLSWDPAPRREAGAGIAEGALSRALSRVGGGDDPGANKGAPLIVSTLDASYAHGQGCTGQDLNHGHSHLVAFGGNNTSGPIDIATAVNAHGGPHGRLDFESETFIAHALRAEGFDASEDGTGRGTPLVPVMGGNAWSDPEATSAGREAHRPIAFDTTQITSKLNRSQPQAGDPCHPLAAGAHPHAIATTMAVRRLTPLECCRLQGFPDDYLDITYRGKPAADGPKYKALGNSMAVPVIAWLGRRIAMVEALARSEAVA